jgi:hypothetical protein
VTPEDLRGALLRGAVETEAARGIDAAAVQEA